MVLGSVLISFFTCNCPVFTAPFIEEAVFAPLYILASFVKKKVPISAGVISGLSILFYLCASMFLCQYHTVLMTVALLYNLKSGRLIPPAPCFFIKTALAIWGLWCLHMKQTILVLWEKSHWYLDRDCIQSVDYIW